MFTNNRRKKQELVGNKRWAGYAAACTASTLVCQGAEASIIHVTVNQVLDASGGPGTMYKTLAFAVGQASSASIIFRHNANASYGIASFAVGGPGALFAGLSTNSFAYALNLAAGQNVSTAGPFLSTSGAMAYNGGYSNSQFLAPGTGFLGFQFNGGAGVQYGWARVDMSGIPVNSFEIIDYAYAGVGEQIRAGSIPEPGSLGLLAAGAAGLALTRRRRRRKTG